MYKDGESMNLNHIGEATKTGKKIKKKDFISLFSKGYQFLDKEQISSFVVLLEKMIIAQSNGERMTIGMRDWNQDGSRRF
jgi:hypothetical protein